MKCDFNKITASKQTLTFYSVNQKVLLAIFNNRTNVDAFCHYNFLYILNTLIQMRNMMLY